MKVYTTNYLAVKYIKPQLMELGEKQIKPFLEEVLALPSQKLLEPHRFLKLRTSMEDLISIGWAFLKLGLTNIFFSQHI